MRASAARAAIEQLYPTVTAISEVEKISNYRAPQHQQNIFEGLAQIDQKLADSYMQAHADLSDPNRISWAGTAHEIREVLATSLRELAPDDQVKAKPWYRQEANDGRPSQRQRVRCVLETRRAGSKVQEVTEQVELIDERVGNLARSMYGRASDAAHRSKERSEVARILNYFEAFAHDLLDLS